MFIPEMALFFMLKVLEKVSEYDIIYLEKREEESYV